MTIFIRIISKKKFNLKGKKMNYVKGSKKINRINLGMTYKIKFNINSRKREMKKCDLLLM